MNALPSRFKTIAATTLLAVNLSACVVAPAGYRTAPAPYQTYQTYPTYPSNQAYPTYPAYQTYGQPQNETITYGPAPPPMRVEVVPALPFAGAIWIAGFWAWEGGRHHWVPGRYAPPVQGRRYERHR